MWWTFLFKAETWRLAWVSLRRANRDRRARRALIGIAAGSLLFSAWLIFEISLLRPLLGSPFSPFGLCFLGALVLGAGFIFWVRRISERRELRATTREFGPATAEQVGRALFDNARVLSVLLTRAASERGIEKEIPPEVEVITRRVQRDLLQAKGLWDWMPVEMRDLLLLPDGNWSAEQKHTVESCWEYMVILLWVFRLDADLSPLHSRAKYKADSLVRLFQWSETKAVEPLPSWDMRPPRDVAQQYFNRCWIELVARGDVKNEIAAEALEEATRFKIEIDEDGGSGDFLVEAKTISELESPQLWFTCLRAHRRAEILSILTNYLGQKVGDDPIRALLTHQINDLHH